VVELVACRDVVRDAWRDAEPEEEHAAADGVPVEDSFMDSVRPTVAVLRVGLRVTD
jgi:hypothetical protein